MSSSPWLCGVMLVLAVAVVPPMESAAKPKGGYLVYIGTYTDGSSKGIYAYRFDATNGDLTPLGLAAETESPSFLAVDPRQRFLYAVNEIDSFQGRKGGAVSAFAIDRASGKLTLLNKVSSGGPGPCHLSVDKTGSTLLVANYSGGSVAVFPIAKNGALGEASAFVQHAGSGADPGRQKGPHAHSIQTSHDNKFAIATDLGLDEVLVYRLNPRKGSLTANDPPFAKVPPGAGPRHFAWRPDGRYAYVINELQSTVTAFSYDAARGAFQESQTITTLPDGFHEENSTAEIEMDRAGRFLYGSNRGHDSIAVFAVDGATGKLTPVEHVKTEGQVPRNFALDPTGAWLFAANQKSNNIVLFRVDSRTGRLTPTGKKVEVGAPVCVTFVR